MKLKVFIVMMIVALIFAGCSNGTDVNDPNDTNEGLNEEEQTSDDEGNVEDEENDDNQNEVTAGALYIGLIDSNFSEFKLINTDDDYNAFKMIDEVKEKINDNNYLEKTLVEIKYVPRDGKNPLISELNKIEKVKTEATFKGMADANFAEFEVYNNMWVFNIADDLKDKFSNMEIDNSVIINLKPGKVAKANMIVFDIEE